MQSFLSNRYRNCTITAALLAALCAGSLAAERVVVCEEITATWCGFCGDVAPIYGQMFDNHPDTFAFVMIHHGDAYATAWGNQRATFYSDFSGYPTSFWDGGIVKLVGVHSYGEMLNAYNARRAVEPDVTIELGASQVDGPLWEVAANVCIEEGGVGKTMRIHMIQVLDYFPTSPSWGRNAFKQARDAIDITLAPGECQEISWNVTLDGDSFTNLEDVRFLAWAQEPQPSSPPSDRAEIYQGAIMNWPFTPLRALTLSIPEAIPEFIDPGVPYEVVVRIEEQAEGYVPDSGLLHYRFDGGTFETVPLTPLEEDLYVGVMPAPNCDAAPEFFVTAEGDGGTVVSLPEAAPDSFFSTTVAEVTTYFEDSFEQDLGWTVESIDLFDGEWERGVPAGDGEFGDPTNDWDGTGQCYLTANRQGNSDVDGGPTILTSPVLDLGAAVDPIIRYARWFTCDDAGTSSEDFMEVEISNDAGATWLPIETVAHSETWYRQELHLADYATLSDQVQVRLVAIDQPNNSKTEAALDAVWVFELSCAEGLVGDLNCDGVVNGFDIDAFVLALSSPDEYEGAFPGCDRQLADVNGDGAVNGFDIDPFVQLLTGF